MKDTQNQRDYRNIPIDKVGIKNLRYPITVRDRRDGFQHTVATINMYVNLPHDYKGTHMSRFVEMLHELNPEVSLKRFSAILENMKTHLNAASAHMEMTFPYFIEKRAPVSTSPGMMDYTCTISGSKWTWSPKSSCQLPLFVPARWRSVISVPTTNAGRCV